MVSAAHRDRNSVRSPGVARALLAALMVLAFIAQGYVAQTHIHEQSRFTSNVCCAGMAHAFSGFGLGFICRDNIRRSALLRSHFPPLAGARASAGD
jgi:hypothetical protein